jgi:hypothetical protein
MADKADLRISDADRERAATVLREHYAAGRLDSSEFEERLEAVYAARTEGEIASLRADLPALPPKPPTRWDVVRQTVVSNRRLRDMILGGGLFPPAVVIWAITGGQGGFWPKYLLIPLIISMFGGSKRRGRRARPQSTTSRHSYRYEYHYGHRHEHGSDD